MTVIGLALLAAESASSPGVPSWVERVSAVGLIIMFGLALARNWVYTSGQVDRILEAERRVSDLWKQTAETQQANADKLAGNLEPVLRSNEAILRAVETIQQEQREQRYRERDQGGRL